MEEKLNYERYKEGYETYKKVMDNVFVKLLNEIPRERVIEILKKKKYIARDWCKKGEVFVEVKDGR